MSSKRGPKPIAVPEQWYVMCNDKFMSGWGRAAGTINTMIFLCETRDEAVAVYENAKARGDQRHIRVYPPSQIPSLYHRNWRKTGADYATNGHFVQIKTKEVYPSWYVPGYFDKDGTI